MATLRLNSLRSDGSVVDETFVYVVKDPTTNEPLVNEATGEPEVTITLLPITQPEWRRLLKKHEKTELDKAARSMSKVTDELAALDELYRRCIVSWFGIVGADDQPLVCNNDTKLHLPGPIKQQVAVALLGADVVDATAESFRQPAA